MSDFSYGTDFLLIASGNVNVTTPVKVIANPTEIPILFGQLFTVENTDPTATVQLTVNFGGAIFTTPVLTLSSSPSNFFSIPYTGSGASIPISYSSVVSGANGEYGLYFRVK